MQAFFPLHERNSDDIDTLHILLHDITSLRQSNVLDMTRGRHLNVGRKLSSHIGPQAKPPADRTSHMLQRPCIRSHASIEPTPAWPVRLTPRASHHVLSHGISNRVPASPSSPSPGVAFHPRPHHNPPAMLSSLGNPRQAATQLLNFALILSTAFMMWKGLSVITDSPSPIVVVLSGSMEPAFQRGDLLFLWNRNVLRDTEVGEVVVYEVRGKDIPIVHRVVRKFGSGEDAQLLTKGDNNLSDDTELYAKGQDYLVRKDIIGSVVAYMPFVGYVTIMLSEHPWLKTVMLGIMGLLVVLQRE